MAITKRHTEGLVSADPVNLPVLSLGARYARILRIRARNWASSAKAAGGTDAAQKIKITDNNGNVVFLDAVDRDYKTAEVVLDPVLDDTATGLGILGVDATGAARAAGEASTGILAESPVTIAIINGTTATDFFAVDLIVDNGTRF